MRGIKEQETKTCFLPGHEKPDAWQYRGRSNCCHGTESSPKHTEMVSKFDHHTWRLAVQGKAVTAHFLLRGNKNGASQFQYVFQIDGCHSRNSQAMVGTEPGKPQCQSEASRHYRKGYSGRRLRYHPSGNRHRNRWNAAGWTASASGYCQGKQDRKTHGHIQCSKVKTH